MLDKKVKAVVLRDKSNLSIEEFEIPNINDGILINVIACGVCGTDPHIVHGSRETGLPIIVGHEFYGEIIKINDNHKVLSNNGRLRKGDLISIVPGIPCGSCGYCIDYKTEPQLCINRKAYGISLKANEYPYLVGGFSQKVIICGGFSVHKVPKEWPLGLGVFLEPMAVATRCIKKCFRHIDKISTGKINIVILGCGPIGFSALLNLDNKDHNIIVVDPIEERRELALKYGANKVVDPFENQDWEGEIKGFMNNVGPDLVVEAAGTLTAFESALTLVRRGGVVAELGNFADIGSIKLSPSFICRNDIVLIGSVLGPPDIYCEAENILSKLSKDTESILKPMFDLINVNNAVENVRTTKLGLKTLIFPND